MPPRSSVVLQVCPRCCLRHAGNRGEIHACAAPPVPELLNKLKACINGGSPQPSMEHHGNHASAAEAHLKGPAEASVLSISGAVQPEHDQGLTPADATGRTLPALRTARAEGSAAQNGHHGAAVQGSGSQDSRAAPCSVCLGVLQCIDSLQPTTPSDDVTAAVQQWDSSSTRAWQPLASCTAHNIAAHVRQASACSGVL